MKNIPAIKIVCKTFNVIAKNMKDYEQYKKHYKKEIVDEVLILYSSATVLEEIGNEKVIEHFR